MSDESAENRRRTGVERQVVWLVCIHVQSVFIKEGDER